MTKAQRNAKTVRQTQVERKAEDERYRLAALRRETAPLARSNAPISIFK